MLPVNLQCVPLFAKADLAATASEYLAREPQTQTGVDSVPWHYSLSKPNRLLGGRRTTLSPFYFRRAGSPPSEELIPILDMQFPFLFTDAQAVSLSGGLQNA